MGPGQLSPLAVTHFVQRVIRVLNPPPDPEPDEAAAHEGRSLSFSLTADSVILAGSLPRLEGEAVIAAIDAFAERLRSEADHVPASARRADGLVALVNAAHATGSIPSRGGLPVSVSVTLDSTAVGDQVVDHLPWAHPHGRGAAVLRVRRAGHPDRDRDRALPRHGRGVPRSRRAGRWRRRTPHPDRPGSPCRPPRHCESRNWPRPCWGRGSRWPSVALPGPRPRLSVGRWRSGTGDASSPAVASPRRRARRTTSRTGRPRATLTYPIWRSFVGRTIARSTWDSGPSCRHPATIRFPDPSPEPHPEPHGPPTTAPRGPSRGRPEHAGGCEATVPTGRRPSPASTTSTSPWSSSPARLSSTCPSS